MLRTFRRAFRREDTSTVSRKGERDALVDQAVCSEDSNWLRKEGTKEDGQKGFEKINLGREDADETHLVRFVDERVEPTWESHERCSKILGKRVTYL